MKNYEKELKKILKSFEQNKDIQNESIRKEKLKNLILNSFKTELIDRYKTSIKNVEQFEKELIQTLENKKFFVYGAGGGGFIFFKNFCEEYKIYPKAFLDKEDKGDFYKSFLKINRCVIVKSLSNKFKELNRFLPVVIAVGKKELQKEIISFLKKEGFKKIITIPEEFWRKWYSQELDKVLSLWFWETFLKIEHYFEKFKENLLKIIEFFGEKKSKEILVTHVKEFLFLEKENMNFKPLEQQYFPEDIKMRKEYNVFIDCGAYLGDTVYYLSKYIGKIDTLVCFEPNLEFYKVLAKYLSENYEKIAKNIISIPCGVYSEETIIKFINTSAGDSHITFDRGNEEIMVVTLDKILSGIVPTFIKMDIEGAELEALKGAKRIIKTYKPDLAICVYHSPIHLVEIPLYLKELVPEYKFYLRKYGKQPLTELVLYATV